MLLVAANPSANADPADDDFDAVPALLFFFFAIALVATNLAYDVRIALKYFSKSVGDTSGNVFLITPWFFNKVCSMRFSSSKRLLSFSIIIIILLLLMLLLLLFVALPVFPSSLAYPNNEYTAEVNPKS
jgi:hypothetical protein